MSRLLFSQTVKKEQFTKMPANSMGMDDGERQWGRIFINATEFSLKQVSLSVARYEATSHESPEDGSALVE